MITKLVPFTIVPTLRMPNAAAPVEPTVNLDKKIKELVVTAVVDTVAVPATNVTDPNEFAPAVVVVATLVLKILLPAVPSTRLPFVAVIAPRVAVSVVDAVNEPVTAVLPVAFPSCKVPVPPVAIWVAAAPVIFIWDVPA